MPSDGLFSVEDRVVVVTGGTGHLGRDICQGLAGAGARVHCIGRDPAKFAVFGAFLKDRPQARLTFHQADVTDEAAVEAAAAAVLAAEGRIDGLVNNAAAITRGIDLDLSLDDWDKGLRGSLSPYFLCARAFGRPMRRARSGVILNNASIWSTQAPNPRMYLDLKNEPPLYVPAAKGAVVQLTRYLASVLAPEGIRVNAFSPGFFPARRGPERPDYMHELTSRIPMGRIGQPRELVGPVLFLLSDSASCITGQNILIDGGYTCW